MAKRKLFLYLVEHYPALAYQNYIRLIIATAFSSLGSQFTVLALSVALFTATGSVASLAGLWGIRVASRLILQPFTGALVDRWELRRVLLLGYVASAVLSASLILVTIAPLAIYPIVFLIQSVEGVVGPAMAAAIPQLVPKETLVSANALRVVVTRVAAALGPALAGLFYDWVGPVWLFIFDSLTFLFVAYAIYHLPEEALKVTPRSNKTSLWFDAQEGIRLAISNAKIFTILLLSMLTSMFWRVVEIVMVPISIDITHVGAEGLGLLYTSLTLGGITGSAVLGTLMREIPSVYRVILFNTALGLPMLLVGLVPSPLVMIGAFFISGLLFDVAGVSAQSLLQASTPSGYLGRIFSLINVSLALGVVPVLLGISPLVEWLGATGALKAASGTLLAGGLLLSAWTKFRLRLATSKEGGASHESV